MSQKRWENSQFTPEGSRREMQRSLRLIAGLAVDGNRKAAIAFAARVLGIPVARVQEMMYGRARRIDAHEADRIRAYVWQAELVQLNAEIRKFRGEAPASLVAVAPKPLPDLEAQPTPIGRKRA